MGYVFFSHPPLCHKVQTFTEGFDEYSSNFQVTYRHPNSRDINLIENLWFDREQVCVVAQPFTCMGNRGPVNEHSVPDTSDYLPVPRQVNASLRASDFMGLSRIKKTVIQ